jgi:hypothetical protein
MPDVVFTPFGATSTVPVQRAAINANTNGDGNVLVAAVAGKQILVLKFSLVVAGAVNAKFRTFDGVSTYADLTGAFPLGANGGVSGAYSNLGHIITQVGQALTLNLSSGVQASGYLVYVLV